MKKKGKFYVRYSPSWKDLLVADESNKLVRSLAAAGLCEGQFHNVFGKLPNDKDVFCIEFEIKKVTKVKK